MTAKANGKAKFRKCFRRPFCPPRAVPQGHRECTFEGRAPSLRGKKFGLSLYHFGGKLCRQCPDNAGRRRVQFAGLKSGVVDGQIANNSNSKEGTILSHMQIREADHAGHLRVLISQNPLRTLITSLAACWRRPVPPLEPEPSIKMRH